MAKKSNHIITGDDSKHTNAAVEWLRQHGATIVDFEGLSLITLPETMELYHDNSKGWLYTVSLKDESEESFVEVQSNADPYAVWLYLEK